MFFVLLKPNWINPNKKLLNNNFAISIFFYFLAKNDYDEKDSRNDWILGGLWPGQSITTVSQAQWCGGTEYQIARLATERAALAEWVDMNHT